METEKAIESFKRYINSQEQKLDDYYRMDEEFYKDEIDQLELSLKLLRTILKELEKKENYTNYLEEKLMYALGPKNKEFAKNTKTDFKGIIKIKRLNPDFIAALSGTGGKTYAEK